MTQSTYQKAETIFNGNNIYIFLGKDENDKLLITPESMWSEELGISYHQFSYKNDIISTIERKDEQQKIKDFLVGNDKFKVNAITGRAGNGKSRLVYYTFKDEEIKQEWSVYGLSYEELQYFKYHYICQLIGQGLIKKKILFVIDYVTINVDQIGKWIKQLYFNSKVDKEKIYIRILLVERAHVTEDRKPYWYMRLVKGNKPEDLGLCNYRDHIQVHNLEDDQLGTIFVEYVKKNEEKYKKIYGVELDLDKCQAEADKIIKTLGKECKTPLYIMYIADAWIDDNSRKGRNWNREESLEYVAKKEDERIKGFFSGNKEKEAALRKILVFSMALNGVKLGKSRPVFLNKEFELIRKEFGDDNPNLRHLFNEVGKLVNEKEITLKSVLPEIVGEFYSLRYLTNILYNDFDNTYLKQFIEYAWRENPTAFASFLCRVIEDFPDHSLVDFSGILEMPTFNTAEAKVLYADVLREYTFWNKEISKYYAAILGNFESLFDGETCKEVLINVCEKYAIALLNMAWWCKQEIYSNKVNECEKVILKKMKEICGRASDEIICEACRSVGVALGTREEIEC